MYTTKGKTDSQNESNSLGYILTNKAKEVSIAEDWIFNKSISVNTITSTTESVSFETGIYSKSNITCESGIIGGMCNINVAGTIGCLGNISTESTISTTNGNIEITTKGNFSTKNGNISTDSGYCQATYFNATSDVRAKENVQLATYNALALIEKLPVYIYNYKNDKDTVTGILAQDLLALQPQELQLVSNINATGENEDYMSIKHDKIMFVLMKAIQEQQQQIKELQKEIDQLKNK